MTRSRIGRGVAGLALAHLTVLGALPAQGAWLQVSAAPPSDGDALAYDSARGRHVLFGGTRDNSTWPLAETWEWDGTWTCRSPVVAPSARRDHAMAYDSARGVVVLFGGNSGAQALGDTWEWDGATWAQRTPAAAPAPRLYHSMAYDPTRGVVVLVGGQGFAETWTWNGTSWSQACLSSQPPSAGSIAFDAARDEVVLVTGDETWTWDGSDWTRETPASSPPSLRWYGMAFDAVRARAVLVGETTGGFVQTWEWDGNDWLQVVPATRPPSARYDLAFDVARQRVAMFGPLETWLWDGVDWELHVPGQYPRDRGAICHDSLRAEVLMFGGYDNDETWTWDGRTWTQLLPANRPPAMAWSSIAFDRGRGRAVLFGEPTASGSPPELWEWDGTDWSRRNPANQPPDPGPMAYDAARGVTVLLRADPYQPADFWEWDGTAWSRHPTATVLGTGPLAYDSGRQRVVLATAVQLQSLQIWEWDGNTLERVLEEALPFGGWAWGGLAAVHDPGRRLTFIVYVNGPQVGVGAWTGSGLHWLTSTVGSPGGLFASIAFDEARGELLSFGGCSSPSWCQPETWLYRPGEPALVELFGSACQGSTLPSLAPAPGQTPRLGRSFVLSLDRLPPVGAAGLVGLSRTSAGPFALPLDLDAIGMPGCTLLVDPAVPISLPVTGGAATWPIAIPVSPSLLGLWFFGQGFVCDPSGNPFGATMTGAFAARVGQ